MNSCTWLSLVRGRDQNILLKHKQAYNLLKYGGKETRPDLIAFIGQSRKSAALRLLYSVPEGQILEPHGEVKLWCHPFSQELSTVYLDCEIHHPTMRRSPSPPRGPINRWRLSNSRDRFTGPSTKKAYQTIGREIYSRILAPFSSVFCLFAADLGGPRGVAETVAEQLALCVESDLSSAVSPRVIVVVSSCGKDFDALRYGEELLKLIVSFAKTFKTYHSDHDIRNEIFSRFKDIEVVGFSNGASASQRIRQLQLRIMQQANKVRTARRANHCHFSAAHFHAFANVAIEALSNDSKDRLLFARASHARLQPPEELESHMEELMSKMSTNAIRELVVPLLSSALILNSCPPGMHFFPPSQVFDQVYAEPCLRAIRNFPIDHSCRTEFLLDLKESFRSRYKFVSSRTETAAASHRKCLRTLRPQLAVIKSHRTCLCCVMRMPEKVLPCGHALCDLCVRIFGRRAGSEKHSFTLPECVLCGNQNLPPVFRLLPPTAGTRVLSLDGGGVKGVLPLVFLHHVERQFSELGCSVRDHFDLVCGTSSGGLVILGIFLMQWSPLQCLEKFENFASAVFQRRSQCTNMFERIHELLLAYLADCRYDSARIEEALQATFGERTRMFNPLRCDTRVAVTTTTARDSLPCLFTNYNGGQRPRAAGYSLIRATDPDHDVLIKDAARCTSAAPWFFKPKVLKNLGTFQDGGLRHNNPMGIALWESKFLWPLKGEPDFALSLGTGAVDTISPTKQGFSPVRDRFVSRLFKTFMLSMDGDKSWRELVNTLPIQSRSRYCRINLPLNECHQPLDDVNNIPGLKAKAEDFIQSGARLNGIRDATFASMFYFELEGLPEHNKDGELLCHGNVFCRLNQDQQGRQALYRLLQERSAYFLVNGHPMICVERLPRSMPPFKRKIEFTLQHESDSVGISIRTVTMAPRSISGQPTTIEQMVKAQMLDAPFGRPDHVATEKELPQVPEKRKIETDHTRSMRRRGLCP